MTERTLKFLLFLVISLTIRGMYDFLFPACFSQDLVSWNKVSDVLGAGENPYHATRVLNWPPSVDAAYFSVQKNLAGHAFVL